MPAFTPKENIDEFSQHLRSLAAQLDDEAKAPPCSEAGMCRDAAEFIDVAVTTLRLYECIQDETGDYARQCLSALDRLAVRGPVNRTNT